MPLFYAILPKQRIPTPSIPSMRFRRAHASRIPNPQPASGRAFGIVFAARQADLDFPKPQALSQT